MSACPDAVDGTATALTTLTAYSVALTAGARADSPGCVDTLVDARA